MTSDQEVEDFEVMLSRPSSRDLYESFKEYKRCLSMLPKSELIKRGWLSEEEGRASSWNLFVQVHKKNQSALYRKNNSSDDPRILMWLSEVKSEASLKLFQKSLNDFHGIDKKYMQSIAKMSPDVSAVKHLPSILKEKGIILIYCRSLPGMKLDGVVFKLDSGHPVIAVSFRYPRLDNFWFTFMHEMAHICMHMENMDAPILEDLDIESKEDLEIEADRLAKSSFVSRSEWRNCEAKYNKSDRAVEEFAGSIGVHKAIVAGMLRREQNDYSRYSNLVNEIDIREEVFGDD